jgi:hypothetical protein
MVDDFIAKNDYKLITFTKVDKTIIKRIKDYAKRNFRKEIETSYITYTLNNFHYGFSFFRTEILNIDKSEKNRPCAFACIQIIDENDEEKKDNRLYVILICTIKNSENFGSKLLNKIDEYAKNNGITKITLECSINVMKFYEKHNFIENGKLEKNMISMIKTL